MSYTLTDENDDVITRPADGARAEFQDEYLAMIEARDLSRQTSDMIRVYHGTTVVAIAFDGVVFRP